MNNQIETLKATKRMNISPYVIPLLKKDLMTIPKIQGTICEYLEISVPEMMSKSRKGVYVKSRMFAYEFLMKYMKLNKSEIARMYNTDHTTIINGLNRCEDLLITDREFRYDYAQIENELKRLKLY